MLKRILIIALACFVLLATAGGFFVFGYLASESNQNYALANPDPSNLKLNVNLSSEKLWEIVNDYRTSQNLPATKMDERLCIIANARVNETLKTWSHSGMEKKYDSIRQMIGYTNLGENLARDHESESDTLNGWIASPLHKENMLGNYTHSCVATNGSYAVQIFAKY